METDIACHPSGGEASEIQDSARRRNLGFPRMGRPRTHQPTVSLDGLESLPANGGVHPHMPPLATRDRLASTIPPSNWAATFHDSHHHLGSIVLAISDHYLRIPNSWILLHKVSHLPAVPYGHLQDGRSSGKIKLRRSHFRKQGSYCFVRVFHIDHLGRPVSI